MKIKEISVMVCKKVTRNFNSWSVSHSATAEIQEGENPMECMRALRAVLCEKVNEGLGENGRGKLIISQALPQPHAFV